MNCRSLVLIVPAGGQLDYTSDSDHLSSRQSRIRRIWPNGPDKGEVASREGGVIVGRHLVVVKECPQNPIIRETDRVLC